MDQMEPEGEAMPIQQGKEDQWEVAKGNSTSKKHIGTTREDEVDIGNAFKPLVDTTQKIVQLYEGQGTRGKKSRNEGGGGSKINTIS